MHFVCEIFLSDISMHFVCEIVLPDISLHFCEIFLSGISLHFLRNLNPIELCFELMHIVTFCFSFLIVLCILIRTCAVKPLP